MTFARLLKPVREALAAQGLFQENARLLCAVSGGADSVALLHALSRLRAEAGYALAASHVQHGLRGESSLADERFVRRLCRDLDVPLYVENAGLTGHMDSPGAETRARDCRRRIFARQMEALDIDAVILAHHLDDQAETVLMRLLRGAGAEGLRGMRPAAPFGRGVMLRPFLSVPKRELAAALDGENMEHREDESNQSAMTPRNALRLTVLPALERLFPGAAGHIADAAEALNTDGRFLDAQAERLYEAALYDAAPLYSLKRAPLMEAPDAVARRALRRWFLEGASLRGPMPRERALSHADTLALAALARARTGTSKNLPCDLKAVAGPACLHLLTQSGGPPRAVPAAPCLTVRVGKCGYALGAMEIKQEDVGPDEAIPLNAGEAALPPEVLALGPVLRWPRPEDRIEPFGAPGHKPLRRFLTDRKVDPVFRPYLPVLAVGNEILWIPFLCVSERLRLNAVPNGAVRLRALSDAPYARHR